MINVSISATHEHVVEVEQRIRTIKQRCWGIMGTLPFAYISQQLMISLMQFVIMLLNAFPSNTGISRKWRSRKIYADTSWMLTKIAKHHSEHIAMFMMNLIHQIQWFPAHSMELTWGQLKIYKVLINFCAFKQGRKSNGGHGLKSQCTN